MSVDVNAERAVIAGVCQHGAEVYLDIADMVKVDTFSVEINQHLFKCVEYIFKEDVHAKVDLPSILGAAKHLGLDTIINRPNNLTHLSSILQFRVEASNVRKFAGKIRRLQVARLMSDQAAALQAKMRELDGSETISQIIGMAEDIIFDFSSLMDDGESSPVTIGSNLEEYLEHLAENPVSQMGYSTGFKNYDTAIGGGLRPGTLNVIGARPKTGKTVLSDNMGFYLASKEGLPVLNMDTEMLKEDHQHRTLAMLSEVPINVIETGQFGQKPRDKTRVLEAAKRMKEVPYFHKSIAGAKFEDQLAIMRRWIHKEVGLNPDGTAQPCVIVYDYLKLMESTGISDALREYQMLGFMMTTLHNFAVRYKVPFLIFMQLNRDGIDGEDTNAASGSDRIVWLCSNFSIFKKKSDEEVANDGPETGNRKLVVVVARHGEGHSFGNYINCHMKGWCAKITEGVSKDRIAQSKKDDQASFEVEVHDNEDGEEEFGFNEEPPSQPEE